MEEILVLIGEFVATQLEEVSDVRYVTKEEGYAFHILLNDGKDILLSLT